MSKIEVDKVDPQSGTALEIGTSGDTVTVPSGVGLTLTDSTLLLPTTVTATTEVKTNKISPATGVAFTLGDSGDTFTVPSGATFVNSGTATGFAAIAWQSVVTASTLTAVAGRGYPINTTSNACTVTLPASASVGDQIIFTDYLRTWATYAVTINQNSLKYQGYATPNPVYDTNGESIHIVYVDATQGWVPLYDGAVANETEQIAELTQKAAMAYGVSSGGQVNMKNLVDASGVVAADVTGVGTARSYTAGSTYGGDKGIYGFGQAAGSTKVAMTNLLTNVGVIGTDVSGVGTAREWIGATGYGVDKAIFAFGHDGSIYVSTSNLVTNVGVVGTDVSGVGTARGTNAACRYGGDKGIVGYGNGPVSMTNLISNVGVVSADVSGVGTAKANRAACAYGEDKGVFGWGYTAVTTLNLVSNVGVVATDSAGAGTARYNVYMHSYGGDKAINVYGENAAGNKVNMSNLMTNTGTMGADVTGVGTARGAGGAAGYET